MEFLTHVTVIAGLAVMAVQQILKLKFVPNQFANKYPVPTLIILSIGAAIVTVWTTSVQPRAWTDWIVFVTTIALVAAFTYNHTLKNWSDLRAMEG